MSNYFHLLLQQTIIFQIIFSHITFLKAVKLSYNSSGSQPQCVQTERQALLQFKGYLTDSSGRLSSWVGHDCCNWVGVGCNNHTGYVIKLDLGTEPENRSSQLHGKLSPSLLDLNQLNYFNFSGNSLDGRLPFFIASLKKLIYLDLSGNNLEGRIPPHLGNLSNLHYLDLSYNSLWASDMNWLSCLTSLEYLNLGYVDLSKASASLPKAVSFLPSISELHLTSCSLDFPISSPSLSITNFTSFFLIDLSWNHLISEIPLWLINITTLMHLDLSWCNTTASVSHLPWFNLHKLEVLDLGSNSITDNIGTFLDVLSEGSNSSLLKLNLKRNNFSGQLGVSLGRLTSLKSLALDYNSISGKIPSSIGRLSFLEELLLTSNKMTGSIPESFGRLSSLSTFDISRNELTGSIPLSFGELSSLTTLDLSYNKMNSYIPESLGKLSSIVAMYLLDNYWKGKISEVHFKKLSKLKFLWISSSNGALVFEMQPGWIPPFSLEEIIPTSCLLGPAFPPWIQTQIELSEITLSEAKISDIIPDWFWTFSTRQVNYLNLSGNKLGGVLPYSLIFNNPNIYYSRAVDLSHNNFHGPIPLCYNVSRLYLRNNSFSGPIPREIGTIMSSLDDLDLSSNFLSGTIPNSISKMENLGALDLSNNKLSGKMLDCLSNLVYLDLSKNDMSGEIKESICSSSSLVWLDLSNNRFNGSLPLSLQDCTRLEGLNLGRNRLSGNIPRWEKKILVSMQLLNLEMNRLTGEIPKELCDIPRLHALDLSHNILSGKIPVCFGNLSRLIVSVDHDDLLLDDVMDFVVKGIRYEFFSNLYLLNTIDLSSNHLTGEIPEEITNLLALGTLNFSRNQFSGAIPKSIGGLRQLETLDLSHNHLFGSIPESIASLTFLNDLDLSFNDLSGPIPSSTQLSTLNDISIYEGNPGLCGDPLPNLCNNPGNRDSNKGEFDEGKGKNKDLDGMFWYGVSLGLGFIMGFWGLIGSLVIKRPWRIAYFKFFYGVKDRLFVFIALKIARLKRTIERGEN